VGRRELRRRYTRAMIGCLIGIIAFFLPRVAILLLGLFSTWIGDPFRALSSPFNGLLLPVLGFIFAPYTLLAYCLAVNQSGGVGGMWLVLVIVAALFDLGVIGGGASQRKRYRKKS
jgi:hypothetical protein